MGDQMRKPYIILLAIILVAIVVACAGKTVVTGKVVMKQIAITRTGNDHIVFVEISKDDGVVIRTNRAVFNQVIRGKSYTFKIGALSNVYNIAEELE
jgi:hypothetical protein